LLVERLGISAMCLFGAHLGWTQRRKNRYTTERMI
jgi:hypothetical protein